jgi:hypothetical protein
MAIETDNPTNEEVEVEEEAVISLPPEEGEEVTEEPEQDFYGNIAETIDDKALSQLASDLISEYQKDKESRKEWEDTYRNGLDLLGFKYKSTTQPFKGASNVTHPLLSEAVTQFQSQAYKELLPSDGPVKTKIVGLQNEMVEAQAHRVKDFMNYQIMEKMEEYTPEFDQLLFYLPLAGSAFKKIYYDALMERAVSKFIPAEDLVVPYFATDLKDAPRITHVLKQSENDLLKKMASGFYRQVDLMKPQKKDNKIQDKYNELEGVKSVETNDYIYSVLEMHVDLDLSDYIADNEEDKINIKIPYIVTIEEGTRKVLSIYRNYKPEDPKFTRKEYFTHFKFLPGLGFYGFGLIHMIGGLSRTATTALRQLLDAGTLSNLPAGFKSRGMRIRDDDQPIQPGEFRDVDAPGGNIRDQFQLLPFKEPSTTLFNLLGFCVDAGRRFASIADMQVGDSNQQAAVGTTIALLERGSRVMSAIHKRCYYAMKQEFKLLASVIAEYLPPEYPYAVYGAERIIKVADFDERVDILPVADPNIFSMSQRVTLAQTQLQIAQSNPQIHNMYEAYRRVYEALGTKEIPQILKPDPKPFPKDPAMENMEALQMQPLTAFPEQDHDAHIAAHSAFMRTRMVQINPMVYANLQGHISQHVSMKASAEVMAMMQQDPNTAQMMQQNPQQFKVMFDSEVAKRVAQITAELAQNENMADMQKQDPVVMLKQRELDLRAMDLQRRASEGSMKLEQNSDQFDERLDFDKMKLEQQDEQSDKRLEVAREKMEKQNVGKKARTTR